MSKTLIKNIWIYLITMVVITTSLFFYLFTGEKAQIVIATKNYTEQILLGIMLEEIIENETNYEVIIKSNLGETSFIHEAITKQDVDVYVEYTSTSFQAVLKQTYNGQSNEEIFEYVDEQYNLQYNLDYVSLLGFDNSNAIACKSFCRENNITNLSQLSLYNFSFAAPAFFYERSDGFNLLIDNYGFSISESNQLKMEQSLSYQGLESNNVDVMLAYTTDGKLADETFIILEDDKSVFPIYDAGIVANKNSLSQYSGLKEALEVLKLQISNEQMQKLNYDVDILGNDIHEVAHQFLIENNLLK